jgi:ABC-2 type transport system permease protein
MYPLFRKEISSFFSSLTGYLVICGFLLANSLFLWIFPGEFNIPDNAYASLDPLFILAPWVFLFLVPAVTMRMLAEERRAGTLELLISRPLTEMHIILSKYFAALVLVLLSLLPTLVYYLSVYILGDPAGNIDTGGTLGSLAGLFFLASIYAAIGLFASSLTDNQVIAFLLSVALSFFFYTGFDSLGTLAGFGALNEFIARLGINEHYRSMSRGVIDSRDIIYFVCVNAILLLFTRLKLQSRRW